MSGAKQARYELEFEQRQERIRRHRRAVAEAQRRGRAYAKAASISVALLDHERVEIVRLAEALTALQIPADERAARDAENRAAELSRALHAAAHRIQRRKQLMARAETLLERIRVTEVHQALTDRKRRLLERASALSTEVTTATMQDDGRAYYSSFSVIAKEGRELEQISSIVAQIECFVEKLTLTGDAVWVENLRPEIRVTLNRALAQPQQLTPAGMRQLEQGVVAQAERAYRDFLAREEQMRTEAVHGEIVRRAYNRVRVGAVRDRVMLLGAQETRHADAQIAEIQRLMQAAEAGVEGEQARLDELLKQLEERLEILPEQVAASLEQEEAARQQCLVQLDTVTEQAAALSHSIESTPVTDRNRALLEARRGSILQELKALRRLAEQPESIARLADVRARLEELGESLERKGVADRIRALLRAAHENGRIRLTPAGTAALSSLADHTLIEAYTADGALSRFAIQQEPGGTLLFQKLSDEEGDGCRLFKDIVALIRDESASTAQLINELEDSIESSSAVQLTDELGESIEIEEERDARERRRELAAWARELG